MGVFQSQQLDEEIVDPAERVDTDVQSTARSIEIVVGRNLDLNRDRKKEEKSNEKVEEEKLIEDEVMNYNQPRYTIKLDTVTKPEHLKAAMKFMKWGCRAIREDSHDLTCFRWSYMITLNLSKESLRFKIPEEIHYVNSVVSDTDCLLKLELLCIPYNYVTKYVKYVKVHAGRQTQMFGLTILLAQSFDVHITVLNVTPNNATLDDRTIKFEFDCLQNWGYGGNGPLKFRDLDAIGFVEEI